ncbi:ABC transporter ATP-binding protein [Rhizobium sp. CNPSo 3968]|uniref:ABC transporter ATP-binding protein n=1 Tax=Rhizobium sp. CNPSo 3968 TaxID=3021408 RepID=UPI00254DB7A3|nr:ABC transporter ATP-binding protein [Rhizobium sp. CNPSo 3968]MDK4717898.1 ABC transporter ATP-binding protein [Rhizobium sp. CNPSo 3968]
MVETILSIRNLEVAFLSSRGTSRVVNGVSFDVNSGETLAIVGESGSGKSVTSLAITRLLDPRSSSIKGQVMLHGRDLTALPEREMRRVRGGEVGMIFQEPMTSLNPVLPVGRQLAETLVLHRKMSTSEARAETKRLFDRVSIPAAASRLDDFPHQFSGGMRQRVMIALALACRPKLLIADEPTTALDVTIQAEILQLLRQLQAEEQMSILFITHDMGVVAEIAHRTLVMFRGNVVEHGDTVDVFHQPRDNYTRTLLAAVPRLGSMAGLSEPTHFVLPDQDQTTAVPAAAISTSGNAASETTSPVLEVKDLVTRFAVNNGFFGRLGGRVHAVENVSFSLKAGETLAVVGESGCGKSTTGRSIMRLDNPLSGEIILDGQDLMKSSAAELRKARTKMQMIFQDPYASLNPRIRIGDAIAEPMLLHGMTNKSDSKDRVAKLLREVGLQPDMMKRYPHEFSGGQRQRISIARALAVRPKLIIADEAVSALDVSVKAQVVNLMLDLQKGLNLSYLFISHDMAVVERVSHRVAVMYLGEIVEIGPRASIFGNPTHPYTQRLLSAVPVPEPRERGKRPAPPIRELPSPIKSPDYVPPRRTYREVSAGHLCQEWDPIVWAR